MLTNNAKIILQPTILNLQFKMYKNYKIRAIQTINH